MLHLYLLFLLLTLNNLVLARLLKLSKMCSLVNIFRKYYYHSSSRSWNYSQVQDLMLSVISNFVVTLSF